MIKIGDFSKLGRVTVKTLRYYESEGLLVPARVDEETSYRFYDTAQLLDLSKIISLRQTGFTIAEIKEYLKSNSTDILTEKKDNLKIELKEIQNKLLKIDFLIKEQDMKNEVFEKILPEHIVYYKEGVLKNYSDATAFILGSAKECLALNPDIKCVQPDYCFMSYLDGEYKEHDVKVRYSQAVTKAGKESETIKFEKLKSVKAVCTYHKGPYVTLGKSYAFIIKWIEDNGYKICAPIREMYIDGVWNKQDENDWLTEIQVPVE